MVDFNHPIVKKLIYYSLMIKQLKLITLTKPIIINALALILIVYFLTSFFYKMITFVADVDRPYMKKKNEHLSKLNDEDKDELNSIKQNSKKTRTKIALFALLLSLVFIFFLRNLFLL